MVRFETKKQSSLKKYYAVEWVASIHLIRAHLKIEEKI
jgi:hypothetical protein